MRVTLIGGGVLARAVCRALVERGERVSLLSPRRVELPALWIQGEVVEGRGLRGAVRDAERVVWLAHRQDGLNELYEVGLRNVAAASHQAGAGLVVVAPRGAAPDASVPALRSVHAALHASSGLMDSSLLLPSLFGRGAHLLGPWLSAAERGQALRVRRADQELRPLWIQDAVGLILSALDRPRGRVSVCGPETHTLGGLADKVCALTGARRGWLPGLSSPRPLDLELLAGQLQGPDAWPEDLGPRRTVDQFLSEALASASS